MIRSTTESERLFNMAVSRIPGGVNSPVRAFKQVGGTPVYIKKGYGSNIMDEDGNEYVDFCQSWGPLILGHAHPEVIHAVAESLSNGLSYGACHSKEIEIADLILAGFPEMDNVRLVSSGTEAVMTALRLARGYTKRPYVIKFDGCYHGHYDGMLVKSGSGLATLSIASSAGVPEEISKTTLVVNLDDPVSVERMFEQYGKEIAAVIIEPIPANNGLLKQKEGFLSFLREITHHYQSVLIFDEVISGFRFNYGGYCREIGVQPDLVTLGKIIGGGMPVGAIVGKEEIMSLLAPVGNVYQAGTLSGNPVSLAAGIATLQHLKKENPYPALHQLGELFVQTLASGNKSNIQAFHHGSIVWIYLDEGEAPRSAKQISHKAMERFTSLYGKLLDEGYYLPPSSFEVLFLSTAHTREQVANLAKSILAQLNE